MRAMTRAEVYEKYADQLVRFATGLVGPTDSRDVVSSAMVKVLWSDRWEGVVDQRAYLYKAVLNEARQSRRSAGRRRALEAKVGAVTVDYQPEVRPEVLQAVSRLSISQRAVVFLAYWEDLRPAEIARRLGLSEGTVHRQLSRGETRLRRILT